MPTTGTREGDDLSRGELRDAALSGAKWVGIVRLSAEVLQFATSVALARLIAPADFGYAVLALLLPRISVTLIYQGFGSVLVQRSIFDRQEAETAEALSIVFGFAATAGLWLTIPLWGEPLFGSRTAELVQMAAPIFAITGFGIVSRAKMQRELRFRQLSLIEAGSYIAGAVVSVGCAVLGLGAEALVLGVLAMSSMQTGLVCLAERPPRPAIVFTKVRGILAFGAAASAASLAAVMRRNIDYVVMSAQMAPAAVGLYWRGFQLGAGYQQKVSGVLQRLAFPLFARAGDAEDVRLLRSRVVQVNTLTLFPALVLLILIAPELIPWLYGSEWSEAVVPAQILAVSGMALAVMSGTEQLVLAKGRPRLLLMYNMVFLLLTGVAVLAASTNGIVAISIAVTATYVVMVAVAQVVILKKVAGIRTREVFADFSPALVACGVMLLVGAVARLVLGEPLSLLEGAVVCGAALVSYLLVLRLLFVSQWRFIARLVRQVAWAKSPRRPVLQPQPGEGIGR